MRITRLKDLIRDVVKIDQTVFSYVKTSLRNFGSNHFFLYASSFSYQVVQRLVPAVLPVILLPAIFLSQKLLNQLDMIFVLLPCFLCAASVFIFGVELCNVNSMIRALISVL